MVKYDYRIIRRATHYNVLATVEETEFEFKQLGERGFRYVGHRTIFKLRNKKGDGHTHDPYQDELIFERVIPSEDKTFDLPNFKIEF
jgi:hypothetical protein